MTRQPLAVSKPVMRDLVRLAAMEVPGVLRVGWAAARCADCSQAGRSSCASEEGSWRHASS